MLEKLKKLKIKFASIMNADTFQTVSATVWLFLFSCLLWLFIIGGFCCISGSIGSVCITYIVNTVAVEMGNVATFTHMNGFLCGLFPPIGFGSIPVAIITYIATFII